ncbi:MAG TPA: hypothetical protein VLR90_16490 [Blastocatellia bacterium]|nr:hypothetical protein [Blastocatellia bacterium]
MAKNEANRLKPTTLADDEAAFNALQNVTGYTPANPAYAITALTQAFADMRAAQAAENQAAAALATARDQAVSKEWAVHNLMLGVKDQVRAQFGKDSTQVQELGLKRVSEYKTRKPKSTVAPQ